MICLSGISFSFGVDRGEEVGPVYHGAGMLSSPGFLCGPRRSDRLSPASTDITGLIRC